MLTCVTYAVTESTAATSSSHWLDAILSYKASALWRVCSNVQHSAWMQLGTCSPTGPHNSDQFIRGKHKSDVCVCTRTFYVIKLLSNLLLVPVLCWAGHRGAHNAPFLGYLNALSQSEQAESSNMQWTHKARPVCLYASLYPFACDELVSSVGLQGP
jgi:hypothetical protein